MPNHDRDDEPAPQTKPMLRTWKRDFWLAAAIYLFFEGGSWVSTHRLPPGEPFVLEPHGGAAIKEFAALVLALTIFYVALTFPAFAVRRWLGWTLKAMLFFLFICFLAYLQAEQFIAAVRQPSAFVFVRRFPFPSHTVPFRRWGAVEVKDTGTVRSLSLTDDGYGQHYAIVCRPVWKTDEQANRVLDRLVAALHAAELDPAATTPGRRPPAHGERPQGPDPVLAAPTAR